MNTAIQTELPAALLAEAQTFVNDGLAGNLNELLTEALRRYLDSHATALTENFLHEDVTWGLSPVLHPLDIPQQAANQPPQTPTAISRVRSAPLKTALNRAD